MNEPVEIESDEDVLFSKDAAQRHKLEEEEKHVKELKKKLDEKERVEKLFSGTPSPIESGNSHKPHMKIEVYHSKEETPPKSTTKSKKTVSPGQSTLEAFTSKVPGKLPTNAPDQTSQNSEKEYVFVSQQSTRLSTPDLESMESSDEEDVPTNAQLSSQVATRRVSTSNKSSTVTTPNQPRYTTRGASKQFNLDPDGFETIVSDEKDKTSSSSGKKRIMDDFAARVDRKSQDRNKRKKLPKDVPLPDDSPSPIYDNHSEEIDEMDNIKKRTTKSTSDKKREEPIDLDSQNIPLITQGKLVDRKNKKTVPRSPTKSDGPVNRVINNQTAVLPVRKVKTVMIATTPPLEQGQTSQTSMQTAVRQTPIRNLKISLGEVVHKVPKDAMNNKETIPRKEAFDAYIEYLCKSKVTNGDKWLHACTNQVESEIFWYRDVYFKQYLESFNWSPTFIDGMMGYRQIYLVSKFTNPKPLTKPCQACNGRQTHTSYDKLICKEFCATSEESQKDFRFPDKVESRPIEIIVGHECCQLGILYNALWNWKIKMKQDFHREGMWEIHHKYLDGIKSWCASESLDDFVKWYIDLIKKDHDEPHVEDDILDEDIIQVIESTPPERQGSPDLSQTY